MDFITTRYIDPGDALNATLVNVTEPRHMNSTGSTVHVSQCSDQSLSQSTAATEVRTDTWWTYLRWNASSSAPQAHPSAPNGTHSRSMDAYILSAVPEQPPTSDPTESSQPYTSSAIPAPTQPEGEMKARVDLNSDVIAKRSAPDDQKPHSVQDADTASVPQAPTWYTSWSWYQTPSPAITNAVAPDMNSGSQQDPPHESSEEERSAGDPEAHSTPGQVFSSPQDPSATGSVDYSNPIHSVISANPTGWMSFFTAKAIAMKSITYEKDEGKMEVMEIDDELAPEPISGSSSTPTVTQPSPSQVTKSPARSQARTMDIPPPSFPPARESNDKRPPIPHAVIKPETVANGILERRPSPSPSKKSGVKTPTSPPPPNLVLPTWNDIFHTLPRSAVPREPPSVLSKTLQYVSGVLFSRDEAPLDKGKGKAKDTVYSPYDKALPRTWDVLGGGEAVDVLRGCKRVVVIGVHGWFPGG